jgi:hypothetical protein
MIKDICQFCGWEIVGAQWDNKYQGQLICDDCNMDMMIERQRELEYSNE